jgi:AbrB family looped-hinge helix DNA binding protein
VVTKLVPVVATVSANGLMHVPRAVREGLGLEPGEKVVFFIDEQKRRAVVVPESEGFLFPAEA